MILNLSALVLIGLFLNLLGAIILAYGLIISKSKAIELGVSRLSGETDEQLLGLPKVRDRIKQSRNAKIGVFFLAIGFVFQIIGNWQEYNYYIITFEYPYLKELFSLEFFNKNSGVFSLLFSCVVAVSTVFYVILTRRLVNETARMRETQTEPKINLSIRPRDHSINDLDMIIENIGYAVAKNLKFNVNREFKYRKDRKLSELNLFKKGLSYLAPNQRVEFFFTDIAEDVENKSNKPLIVEVKYTDIVGKSFSNDFTIDFSEYLGLTQKGKPPLYKIIEELSKIRSSIEMVSSSISEFDNINESSDPSENRS